MNVARYLAVCVGQSSVTIDQPQVYSVRVRFIQEDQDGNEFEDYCDVFVKSNTSNAAAKAAMEDVYDLTVQGRVTKVLSGDARAVPNRRLWSIEAKNGKVGRVGELFR